MSGNGMDSSFLFWGAHFVFVFVFLFLFLIVRGLQLIFRVLVYFSNCLSTAISFVGEAIINLLHFNVLKWKDPVIKVFFKKSLRELSTFHSTNIYWAYLSVRAPPRDSKMRHTSFIDCTWFYCASQVLLFFFK